MKKITLFSTLFCVMLCLPFLAGATNIFTDDSDEADVSDLNLSGCYVEHANYDANGRAFIACNSAGGIYYYDSAEASWETIGDVGAGASIASTSTATYFIGGIKAFRVLNDSTTPVELENIHASNQVVANDDYAIFKSRETYISRCNDSGCTNITVNPSVTGVDSIAMAADGTVYVLADDTVWISTDNGATFPNSIAVDNTYEALFVDPDDSNYIIADQGSNCYYSSTGPNNITTAFSTMCSNGPEAVFDLTDSRIFLGTSYTDDNGANWTQLNAPSAEYSMRNEGDVAIDPTDHNNLLAEILGGFATSSDRGATSTINMEGLYGVTVDRIYKSGAEVWLATESGIAHTTNFNDTTPTWDFPILGSPSFPGTTAIYDYDDVVYAGLGGGLYTSTDDGENWTWRETEFGGSMVHDFVEKDGTIYAANNDGVHTSSDGGDTWTDLGLTVSPSVLVFFDDDLYAGGADGVYKYNGSSWTEVYGDGQISGIEATDDAIYAVGFGATESNGIIMKSENGSTWTDVFDDAIDPNVSFDSVIFENDNVGYVGYSQNAGISGLIKTSNGGTSWSPFYSGLIDEDFKDLLFNNTEEVEASALASGGNTGLVIGTSTNVYTIASNAKLTLKASKKKVKKGKKVTLTSRLKDVATNKKLKQKTVKLYKKHKKTGKFKLVKAKKTGNKGKVVFKRKINKKTFFKVRWKVGKSFRDSYGNKTFKSPRRRVKLK
ncbi:MAG: hypothetical protein ABID45_01610 [Patescibacteria group bacterium]